MHTFKTTANLRHNFYSIDQATDFDYDGDLEGGDAKTRISSTVMINDRWFHYTAIEVQDDDAGTAVNRSLQPKLDALSLLAGADADDFRVITVAGRNYVEYLIPFCL